MSPKKQPLDPARRLEALLLNNLSYRSPSDECDLVMKGGITSGVVYPPAIMALAKRYRFCSIGGASAGAIAAAAAAAAEHGRHAPEGGFARLAEMQKQLEEEEGFLLALFQPWSTTAPLYRFVLDVKRYMETDAKTDPTPLEPSLARTLRRWSPRILVLVARHVPLAAAVGAALGLVLGLFAASFVLFAAWHLARSGPHAALLYWPCLLLAGLILALGSIVGWTLAGGVALKRCYGELADRHKGYFGFCPGSGGKKTIASTTPALVDWLSETFNVLAGLDAKGPPLTIGMLKNPVAKGAKPITFKLVTTNLSNARPCVFPLDQGILIFREDDVKPLFPKEVVAYLKEERFKLPTLVLPKGFYALPAGDDLPVVVATRLSLSFPLLLTAVRLYTLPSATLLKLDALDLARKNQQAITPITIEAVELVENWFSDGGIAVNFPISMFDTWLPQRPTFGINLCDAPVPDRLPSPPPIVREQARTRKLHVAGAGAALPAFFSRDRVGEGEGEGEREREPAPVDKAASLPDVVLPKPSDEEAMLPSIVPIEGIVTFFLQMLDTARSYRDNTQMGLASYRERVAQVYLKQYEGGLNLDMPPAVVSKVADKGTKAARLFLEDFDFEEHRWVRMRLLFSHLERELGRLNMKYGEGDTSVLGACRKLLDEQQSQLATKKWYRDADAAWCQKAMSRISELEELVRAWESAKSTVKDTDPPQKDPFFGKDAPTPDGVLRVTPGI